MGSFNVGCGISNLSIHEGDRAGFVLLTPTKGYRSNPAAPRKMQIYATDFFTPFLPPVYGTYDDYGRLDKLEPSATTEVIEAIFLKPALAVVNAAADGRGLYGNYGEICPLYMEAETLEKIDRWGAPNSDTFLALGFSTAEPLDGYLEAYVYRDFRVQRQDANKDNNLNARLSYWSIDRISDGKVLLKNEVVSAGFENLLTSFAKLTDTLPGYAEEFWGPVKILSSLSGMFFLEEIYKGLNDSLNSDEWTLSGLAEQKKVLSEMFDGKPKPPGSIHEGLEHLRSFSQGVFYDPNMILHLKPYGKSDEYLEIAKLVNVMTSLNRPIQPSYNGEQFGNDDASRELNALTETILQVRKHRWDEE